MRQAYVVKTIVSAAHLVGSCDDAGAVDVIMGRAQVMLDRAWTLEHKKLTNTVAEPNLPVAIKAFWDEVAWELTCTTDKHLYNFQAVHGEEVNPPGQKGNVHIVFQVNYSITNFILQLKLQQ